MRFFCFRLEIPFHNKFNPKNQNTLFELKFGTYTNSNMQISIMLITFSVLDSEYTFRENSIKNHHCQFKLRFGTYTNLNMQHSNAAFSIFMHIQYEYAYIFLSINATLSKIHSSCGLPFQTSHKQPLEVFCKKTVFKNFIKFPRKQHCCSLFNGQQLY